MNQRDRKNHFQLFADKMQAEGIPDIVIRNFEYHYQQLLEGETGIISETDIEPVATLPDARELTKKHQEIGQQHLSATVLIKLNGGLGTSMGLNKAKSLIRVKEDQSFLDIAIQHAIDTKVKLLLMNSFNTRDDSLAILKACPELQHGEIELDFLQHKIPKIRQEDFTPAIHEENKQLEWCPPGHGDIFITLMSSGILESLLDASYHYALISNADNLGATLDRSLLGYIVEENIPCLMEVTKRTAMDKKGGHLATDKEGSLILREAAQCSRKDQETFEDISRHQYFNTNNLWVDLRILKSTLKENNHILNLALIRNPKTLDPRDPDSTPVYQLETAMGSAISVFKGAQVIRVPRHRFAPVKTTNELLLVRSDTYKLNRTNHTLSSQLDEVNFPLINLDKRYYKFIDDFELRFPYGPPSLINCQTLNIKGDIRFGKNIVLDGQITLENTSAKQITIADNTHITQSLHWE